MKRRELLKWLGTAPFAGLLAMDLPGAPVTGVPQPARTLRRVRPGEAGWPTTAEWASLNRQTGGHLLQLADPLAACRADPSGTACADFFGNLRNPFFIRDDPALTQASGWVGAWTSRPSAYAVAARSAADVAAAVTFAREHRLRLVVKGGGHSYQGTSCAPDSLLVWTRHLDAITLHDAFVPRGCAGKVAPQPAVSVGAGQIWGHVYNAVTTGGGRYVQGGGCMTVGVAGLVSSGGFGSFSKRYGTAAAGLLEADVVTSDGKIRTVNACRDPDLFWGLKGGGGGSLGIITRLVLRTRELPDFFGLVNATVRATSDAAYRRLVERFVAFYAERLFNPHWGEQVHFRRSYTLRVAMVFQGIDQAAAEAAWRPFFDFVAAAPGDFELVGATEIAALPARKIWGPAMLRSIPGLVVADTRPGAPVDNIVWAADAEQPGMVLAGYLSAWLPQSLLSPARQGRLVDALMAASREDGVTLHCNKGLAGAPSEDLDAARDTAMNPQALDAFALAISAQAGPAAFPELPGHAPDIAVATRQAKACADAMRPLQQLVPGAGSYVSESDFFITDWQRAFWGANYRRLQQVKARYDPDGLFTVHHGVGSEAWSADGFTRLA